MFIQYQIQQTPINEFQINTTTEYNQEFSKVTQLSDGGYLITWISDYTVQPYSYDGVFAQFYDESGRREGQEFLLIDDVVGGGSYAINQLSDGNYYVAWTSGRELLGQVLDSTLSPLGNEIVITNNPTERSSPYQSSIELLPSGDFVVTWIDDRSVVENGFSDVYGRIFSAEGLPTGYEFLINTTLESTQDQHHVSVLSDEGFIVAWTSYTYGSETGNYSLSAQMPTADALELSKRV